MRATVYFVRHGQTEANRDGILQGVTGDYPMTEMGLEEARRTGHALRGVQWDGVFCSDLRRTIVVRITLCGVSHHVTLAFRLQTIFY